MPNRNIENNVSLNLTKSENITYKGFAVRKMRILKYFIYAFAGFINSTRIDVPYFISDAKTFKNECGPKRFVFRFRPFSTEKRL